MLLDLSSHACRYQIQYDVSDSSERPALSLVLNVTFVESVIIIGSFLFIGQAASSSTAQQNVLALCNASSAVNAAFTATVASVFQSWLANTTSAYVSQLVTGQMSDAAGVSASNSARLALFSDVTQPDMQVLNASIDQNITSMLVGGSTAAVQTYVYNVTLQATVLTASLLASVFVDVLNDSDSTVNSRRLLSEPLAMDKLQHNTDTRAWLQPEPNLGTALKQHDDYSSGSSNEYEDSRNRANPRHLQATQTSSAFPLASLMLFKVDLTLAAFQGTSGCSKTSIGNLFYGGADPPEPLQHLCAKSDGDLSFNEALLKLADGSIPLLQVYHIIFPPFNNKSSILNPAAAATGVISESIVRHMRFGASHPCLLPCVCPKVVHVCCCVWMYMLRLYALHHRLSVISDNCPQNCPGFARQFSQMSGSSVRVQALTASST